MKKTKEKDENNAETLRAQRLRREGVGASERPNVGTCEGWGEETNGRGARGNRASWRLTFKGENTRIVTGVSIYLFDIIRTDL